MKLIWAFLLPLLFSCYAVAQCQTQNEITKNWNWIIPLKTKKAEIETVFKKSVDKDKDHPYQTYTTEFGKFTIAYTTEEKNFVKACSCNVEPGTVIRVFISLKDRVKLSDLNLDLSSFEKDDTFSPRELSYSNEKEGLLIATEIVKMPNGEKLERVFAIELRPGVKVKEK